MSVAVITGASRGLGRAFAEALAAAGWQLVLDGRDADALTAASIALAGGPHRIVSGNVTDPSHRTQLVGAAQELGGANLLVNNASSLGASPQPSFADLLPETFVEVLDVNVVAPMALACELLPQLRENHGRVVNISSDAAVEAYEAWGAYAASKAALDHASRILAAEEPDLRVYAVDPGDMRTRMHQEAFPGEDISDRPLPETVVPVLLRLVSGSLPGGRYRATELNAVPA